MMRVTGLRCGWSVIRRASRRLLPCMVVACLATPTPAAAQGSDVVPAMARLLATGARSLGKPALQRDGRLDAAARTLLLQYPDTDSVASPVASAALWQERIVEPIHRLMVVRYATKHPQDMLAGLPSQLRILLGTGRWQRFGIGVVDAPPAGPQAAGDNPDGEGESRAMVVVLESFVQLTAPPPAALGAAPTPLAGTLQPPYGQPRVVLTTPSGVVQTPDLVTHGRAFSCLLPCAEPGRYQVEVLGEDKGGPTVLANFPWSCGSSPTVLPGPPGRALEVGWRDARDAEQQILALLNQDRQRAGLSPLPLDEPLSAVARAHCQDMAAHQFVAHLSPRTGSPADRVHRAGITAALLSENLAQARSPKEAEEGLMGSPGHRANILEPRVNRVGIGVQEIVGVGGMRQLLLTQLFRGDAEPVDLSTAPARVVSALQAQRGAGGLAGLVVDAELTALATRTAAALALGTVTEAHPDAFIAQAVPALRVRFSQVRAALAVTQTPAQISQVPTLVEAEATHIGVAVSRRPAPAGGKAGDTPAIYIVLMIARQAVAR